MHKKGVLLIVDEVQTGFGRTGTMFACEHEDVVPDILCFAKSLSGGFIPIGGYITSDEIWRSAYGKVENNLLHTSTFGGNALACAAGISTINYIVSNSLGERARENGSYFLSELRKIEKRHNVIKEVRGKGLLIGLELLPPEGIIGKQAFIREHFAAFFAGKLLEDHSIITAYTLNNPSVLRLEPPLIVEKGEIDRVVQAIDEVCKKQSEIMNLSLKKGVDLFKSIIRKEI